MRIRVLWTTAAIIMAACGQGAQTPVPPVIIEPQNDSFDALDDDAFSHGVMTLRFYDDTPGDATNELPRFELASSQARYEEGDVWSFEDADAIIRGDNDSEMRIEAGYGRVDHHTKHAFMEGGVRVTTGNLILELEELTWSNTDRVATSDRPVRVLQGGTDLQANSMQLYPDESRVVLFETRGRIEQVDTLGIAPEAEPKPEMETPPA